MSEKYSNQKPSLDAQIRAVASCVVMSQQTIKYAEEMLFPKSAIELRTAHLKDLECALKTLQAVKDGTLNTLPKIKGDICNAPRRSAQHDPILPLDCQ